jgi:hypothetical protein
MFHRIEQHFADHEQLYVSATVLLANTFALTGDLTGASEIRAKLHQMGIRKKPGISTTVVDGQIVVSESSSDCFSNHVIRYSIQHFKAHDTSHPQSKEIYEELERLGHELAEHGYESDSS